MKLAAAHYTSLNESARLIIEDGEAPTWRFDYDTAKQDATPNLLLLGAYRHPNTGNNLVGGINLNYLSQQQQDQLARVLPKIMQAGNLYQRYHTGKNLMPDVFDSTYRTYNAANIRGVQQGVMYPKYGMLKATQNFVTKKIGGMFKSKAARAKAAEPKFPSDLSGMSNALDQVVQKLNTQPQPQISQNAPEMQVARQEFNRSELERQRSMSDIERQEDQPFIQANQQLQTTQLQQGKTAPQQVSPQAVQMNQTQQPEMTTAQMGQQIARDRAENQEELTDPNNELDLDAYSESIIYYCPIAKRYLIESLMDALEDEDDSISQY